MNRKVSIFLKQYSGATNKPLKETKILWNNTPRKKRAILKESMELEIKKLKKKGKK